MLVAYGNLFCVYARPCINNIHSVVGIVTYLDFVVVKMHEF